MPQPINGKYRIQVSLTEEEYQALRALAYDKEVTVNELLRILAINIARDFVENG